MNQKNPQADRIVLSEQWIHKAQQRKAHRTAQMPSAHHRHTLTMPDSNYTNNKIKKVFIYLQKNWGEKWIRNFIVTAVEFFV